jgi:hypothetical protein
LIGFGWRDSLVLQLFGGQREYLATPGDPPSVQPEVRPKFISPSDPAAQWTGAHKGHAFFAYANDERRYSN